MQCSQFASVCMYVCTYIRHTLISVGSLVAHVYRHNMHVVTMTQMQALREWTLMEPELSLCDRARTQKWKQRATASHESRTKKRERDGVRKKRCIQGESSSHK